MSDKSKVIWLTGASSGIGKTIAELFVKKNHKVVCCSRNIDKLKKLKSELESDSRLIKIYKLDVANPNEVFDTYQEIKKEADIDCLINNAGITSFNAAKDDSVEEIRKIIETNLLGSIYTIKAVLPDFIKKKHGTIINILSVVTKKIFENSSVYSASKQGLLAYTNVLREEVREHNIRVINIIPGATKTPIWSNDILEKYSQRMMTPNDISKIVFDVFSLNTNIVAEEIVLRPIKGDL
ncbi:SDR family oxidoreductase [Melioribacteraceae bacterium 4301-Me]|uniref:SDR family oxidoreductase n=1 Tax=Pyranulibacter aquaticus TaxID=3163344 RepID=UPI003599638B